MTMNLQGTSHMFSPFVLFLGVWLLLFVIEFTDLNEGVG